MSLDQPTTHGGSHSPDPDSPPGALQRLLAGWRRLEEAMDYGPFDYTNERLRGLEMRIEQLEQRLAAVLNHPGSPTLSSTLLTIASEQR